MFYLSPFDFAAQNPSYVEYTQQSISVPKAQEIKDEIDRKKEEEKRNQMGDLNYYIQKYAPYVVGAIILSFLLPAINSIRKK
jgi:hypothetical protein